MAEQVLNCPAPMPPEMGFVWGLTGTGAEIQLAFPDVHIHPALWDDTYGVLFFTVRGKERYCQIGFGDDAKLLDHAWRDIIQVLYL